ncbi:hypothetical protein [Thiofilum flexile]|uniref:hypothetical protein n=1 Tax=Thiofilum flexile TaxID=125627 RepID=UPI00037BF419|nr:hypothetical protein [Thiofilum flexile]
MKLKIYSIIFLACIFYNISNTQVVADNIKGNIIKDSKKVILNQKSIGYIPKSSASYSNKNLEINSIKCNANIFKSNLLPNDLGQYSFVDFNIKPSYFFDEIKNINCTLNSAMNSRMEKLHLLVSNRLSKEEKIKFDENMKFECDQDKLSFLIDSLMFLEVKK